MNVVALMGGLGNQMYQLSLGAVLERHTGVPTRYALDMLDFYKDRELELEGIGLHVPRAAPADLRAMLGAHRTSPGVRRLLASRWGRGLAGRRFVAEDGQAADQLLARADDAGGAYFHGYWQSADIVARADAPLWSSFRFPQIADPVAVSWRNRIHSCKNSVAIHVRLGDYSHNTKALRHHGLLDAVYYQTACQKLLSLADNVDFFVFSDEPERARSLFDSVPGRLSFVERHGGDAWADMSLMASCRHNIIANSTYSWWAAWLNRHPDRIVVAPSPWFADGTSETGLVPTDWLRIPR